MTITRRLTAAHASGHSFGGPESEGTWRTGQSSCSRSSYSCCAYLGPRALPHLPARPAAWHLAPCHWSWSLGQASLGQCGPATCLHGRTGAQHIWGQGPAGGQAARCWGWRVQPPRAQQVEQHVQAAQTEPEGPSQGWRNGDNRWGRALSPPLGDLLSAGQDDPWGLCVGATIRVSSGALK